MSKKCTTGKTVYFLGAGASKGSKFKLPLMKGFFQKELLFSDEYRPLCEFIMKKFPQALKEKIDIEKTSLDSIDPTDVDLRDISLEDVITYLELGIDEFGSFGRPVDSAVFDARTKFNELVHRRLLYPKKDGKDWCPGFKSVFERLAKEDTIITLNYDLIVENTLNRIQVELDKGSKTEHQLCAKMRSFLCPRIYTNGEIKVYVEKEAWNDGWYLKLHGSLNWVSCTNPKCLNHFIVNIVNSGPDRKPFICQACGSHIEWLIVPPTMNKLFTRYPKLGMTWSIAWQELVKATKVIFIGISFAPSDYYLRWLIKSAFLNSESKEKSIVLIDKDHKSVGKKIKEMVGEEAEHYYPCIEKYTKALDKEQ